MIMTFPKPCDPTFEQFFGTEIPQLSKNSRGDLFCDFLLNVVVSFNLIIIVGEPRPRYAQTAWEWDTFML